MTQGKKNNQNNAGGPGDKEPGELIELLKNFYQPGQKDITEFNDFYQAIEDKLEAQNPVNKISQASDELEEKYKKRQEKFEHFINQLEDNLSTTRKDLVKRAKKRKQITLITIVLAIIIAATSLGLYLKSNFINVSSDNQGITLKIKNPTSNN